MIHNDQELAAVQQRLQVVQAMLTHARNTLTPGSFRAQSQGWLLEWERLQAQMRDYLSAPVERAAYPPKSHSMET